MSCTCHSCWMSWMSFPELCKDAIATQSKMWLVPTNSSVKESFKNCNYNTFSNPALCLNNAVGYYLNSVAIVKIFFLNKVPYWHFATKCCGGQPDPSLPQMYKEKDVLINEISCFFPPGILFKWPFPVKKKQKKQAHWLFNINWENRFPFIQSVQPRSPKSSLTFKLLYFSKTHSGVNTNYYLQLMQGTNLLL